MLPQRLREDQELPDTTVLTAIGLMSGTSMDGIDVALIETDGRSHVVSGPSMTMPYTRAFRRRIGTAIGLAQSLTDRHDRPGELAQIEHDLTTLHANAVTEFCSATGKDLSSVDLVGFHGHTILHRPSSGLTLQLGDGAALANALKTPVAYDIRAADVAAGGQGAPLAPAYHRAMLPASAELPAVVLNIGGVANVTWVGGAHHSQLLAFDTGPGNALIDDWMAKSIGATRDEGGAAALAGQADARAVAFFLGHDYFSAQPPKSLDRNAFFWDLVEGLSPADGAATLTAMTVGAVAKACEHFPVKPRSWVVCGGGRHNAAIMRGLSGSLPGIVLTAEDVGLDGDAIEAQAWAYLAVRCRRGLEITFPGTTGASKPMTGGQLAMPRH